jgi:hypothetical protein
MHAYDKRWLQSYHISVCFLSQHMHFSPYMSLLLMCLDVLRFDICAFDNLPQLQAFWQHRLFTLDMNSFRKWLRFHLPFYSGPPCLFISYTPDIFHNIFRWQFFLERNISMIFCGHNHIIITHCYHQIYGHLCVW